MPQDNNAQTEAQKIWNEIQNKPVQMFALPNQMVSNYCTPTPVDPKRCFLTYSAPAIIPALEEALGVNYNVELAERYIIVSRKEHNVG